MIVHNSLQRTDVIAALGSNLLNFRGIEGDPGGKSSKQSKGQQEQLCSIQHSCQLGDQLPNVMFVIGYRGQSSLFSFMGQMAGTENKEYVDCLLAALLCLPVSSI